MSKHYYADGAKHYDHHREINIGGNVTADALEKLMKGFFADAEDVHYEDADEQTPINNYIFNPRIFDSTERLECLRTVIAHAIDIGADNAQYGEKNEYVLNLRQKNEWYYLMQALVESGVVRGVPTVADLYRQMMEWFPAIAHLNEGEMEENFVTRLTKSISAERSKWRDMGTDRIIPLKEIVIKNQAHERIKPDRVRDLYKAAYSGLCLKLLALCRLE